MAATPRGSAEPAVDDLKRRGRRRLVGAIVLALAAAVVLPMLLESDPSRSATTYRCAFRRSTTASSSTRCRPIAVADAAVPDAKTPRKSIADAERRALGQPCLRRRSPTPCRARDSGRHAPVRCAPRRAAPQSRRAPPARIRRRRGRVEAPQPSRDRSEADPRRPRPKRAAKAEAPSPSPRRPSPSRCGASAAARPSPTPAPAKRARCDREAGRGADRAAHSSCRSAPSPTPRRRASSRRRSRAAASRPTPKACRRRSGTVHRVRVGPFATREEADAALGEAQGRRPTTALLVHARPSDRVRLRRHRHRRRCRRCSASSRGFVREVMSLLALGRRGHRRDPAGAPMLATWFPECGGAPATRYLIALRGHRSSSCSSSARCWAGCSAALMRAMGLGFLDRLLGAVVRRGTRRAYCCHRCTGRGLSRPAAARIGGRMHGLRRRWWRRR